MSRFSAPCLLQTVAVVWTLTAGAGTAAGHGLSDIDGSFLVGPVGAGPGELARLVVTLKPLKPGAAEGARVRARIESRDRPRQDVELTPLNDLSYEGRFPLGEDFHDLRVIVDRDSSSVFALGGFYVSPRLVAAKSTEDSTLWFVPSGRFAALPWLDNLFGALAAAAALMVIIALLAPGWGKQRLQWSAHPGVLVLAAGGALSMPFGAYWDISFHTESGRESFFSPPHLLIFGGIVLTLLAVLVSVGRKEEGTSWWRHLRQRPQAFMAASALAVQLAAGPLDELWHALFGLDVSIWSPPHVILIAGGVAVCLSLARVPVAKSAVFLETVRILVLGGALLICAVFLSEFEFVFPGWHISQRRPSWLHPAMFGLFMIMISVVASRSVPGRWGSTFAFMAFLVLRMLVYPFLALVGRPITPQFVPWMPALAILAIAMDLGMAHRSLANDVLVRSRGEKTSPEGGKG